MDHPPRPPRKSGRFSGTHTPPPPGQAGRDMGLKQPEYAQTAFSTRRYGNTPQKHEALPRAKRTRYRDMSPREQRTARRLWVAAVLGGLAGFVLCGLALRLVFS